MFVSIDVTTSARDLPNDVDALKALIAARDEALATKDQRIAHLEHQVRLLRKELFAPKSERRPSANFVSDANQMHLLFPEIIEAAERIADANQVQGSVEFRSAGQVRSPKRRAQFPAHLPVIRTNFELTGADRRCACGAELSEIGEEISKELERLEISVVHEIARKKYACKRCESNVKIAPGPERVIDKGILGVGFLAHVLVERFGHHMPYNRLESKYQSEGFELSRSVLCESAVRCAELLAPIAEQIKKDALASGIVQTDDTPVTIQEGSEKCSRRGHVWVYRGHGGETFFHATESRGRDGPANVLAGFTGYMQADAYIAYNEFFKGGRIVEVGCWAHARRLVHRR